MSKFFELLLWGVLLLPSFLYGQYKERQQKRERIERPLHLPTGAYQLIFQEDFEESRLDTAIWRTAYGNPKPWDCTLPRKACGTELQIYRPDNLEVSDGTLKITARKQVYLYEGVYEQEHSCAQKKIGDDFQLSFDYTSGIIETRADKIAFRYGRFETRCRLPKGAGLWPAFWLWGGGGETGRAGEIDIFEIFDTSQPIFTTSVHNGNIEEWHTYAMEWDALAIRYFVDDKLIRTLPRFTNKRLSSRSVIPRGRHRRNPAFPWEQWMVLRLNLAINPEEGQTVQDTTIFPAIMEVDYVRVYEKVVSGKR